MADDAVEAANGPNWVANIRYTRKESTKACAPAAVKAFNQGAWGLELKGFVSFRRLVQKCPKDLRILNTHPPDLLFLLALIRRQ